MKDPLRKYCKAFLNLFAAFIILLFVIFVVPRVFRFFMPFVIGWIIAMIANPVVRFLDEKIKIRRKAGSAIVIISVIALIIGAGYGIGVVLVREAVGFVSELPKLWQAVEEDMTHAGMTLETIFQHSSPQLHTQIGNLLDALAGLGSSIANKLGSPTVTAVGNFAKNLPSVFVGIVMCLLSSYFFVAQRNEVVDFFRKYTSESIQQKWILLYQNLKNAVGGYFKAQLKIEIWMYLLLVIGFSVIGVQYAALIALGIAFLDFLPVFGTGTVLIPWAVIKLLTGDLKMAVSLLIIYCVGQLVRQLIQPKIVGDSIGVPAIPTLFLIFIGYKIGSVAGMILAVPVGLILANMYQAGFFSATLDSIRILVHGFNHFRRLTDEDKKDIQKK